MCHGKGKEGEKSYILTMKFSVRLLVHTFLRNRKFGTPNFALFPVISLQIPCILQRHVVLEIIIPICLEFYMQLFKYLRFYFPTHISSYFKNLF